LIGQTFGSYRAVRVVGRGGMGVVYAAEHPLLGSQAVVKQLRPELSAQRDLIERFFNEARALSRIVHPGIVSIFDFGYSADGTAYFVMEYLDGESVAARLARSGPLGEAHAARLGRQIAGALAAAHEAGIVHRDLKPDNVFLVPDEAVAGGERAKILDFGIAKLGGEAGEGVAVTRTGALLGSPLYMSPEQCRGTGEVDFRADVYALGCLLFAMVCGRPPFVGDGVGEIIGKHIYEQPPRPRELVPAISAGLDAVIMRALEKDPARRHPSMRGFAAALEGGGGEAVAPVVSAGAPAGAASFAATADTILSTAPEAAPTVPAALVSGAPPVEVAASAGGGRQRTVAMWIAAALAAGMAAFFLLARVDDEGGGRPGRVDQATPSGAARAPEPIPAGGGSAASSFEAHADQATTAGPNPTAGDAGPADEVAETQPPDAGPATRRLGTKRLGTKRATAEPPNVSPMKRGPPEAKRTADDEPVPEEPPAQQAAE
jgi:tRNA A-37 threonylcarbamoyl transferase component Bud32